MCRPRYHSPPSTGDPDLHFSNGGLLAGHARAMNGAMRGLVSGVVLAAGSARRMNAQKLLLDVGGRPLVRVVEEDET
jgi:hypothetical protein